MKRTKQDKQFMIQLDVANRDFLNNISIFLMSFVISVVSLFLSTIAIVIALTGISVYSITISVIFGFGCVIAAFYYSKKIKKIIQDSKNLNAQAQKELFKLYPEYKNKLH